MLSDQTGLVSEAYVAAARDAKDLAVKPTSAKGPKTVTIRAAPRETVEFRLVRRASLACKPTCGRLR